MGNFRMEIKPRNLLNLDEPEKHLTPGQFAFALLMMALSAAFWSYVTGSVMLIGVIAAGQTVSIWRTPAAVEKSSLRFGVAFLWGAICAAGWLILKRFGLSH
jgi:hypothetical protein